MSLLSAPEEFTPPGDLTASTSLLESIDAKNKDRTKSTLTGFDRWHRWLVAGRLKRISRGGLTIVFGDDRQFFGDSNSDLQATITVRRPAFYRRVVFGGGLGAAESLIDGDWSCDNLVALVRIFIRNLDLADGMDRGMATVRRFFARIGHYLRRNHRASAANNIRKHYDLGNDFFRLFLDDTLSYSCAVFSKPTDSLQEASIAKLDRVARKLNLSPSDHLLEIGTGWGGLAMHVAKNYGCKVTTTTISREQFDLATSRIQAAGLSNRITVLKEDYRDLTGRYDKLVSIEMIEAVGHEFYETFFHKCCDLLHSGGLMLLQSITIKEQRYEQHLQSVDFIREFIFPGGCLPSVGAMMQAVTRSTDMRPLHLEDITPHYAETLRRWRVMFWTNIDAIRALGYGESFIRLWDYYFAYCEAGFEERQIGDVQLLLARPDAVIDATKLLAAQ